MDLDASAIWIATRSEAALKAARGAGLDEDLFSAQGKVAWNYIDTYRLEYGVIPSPSIIAENSGLHPVPVEDGVHLDYVLDKMHERSIWRALKYGGTKFMERMEEGESEEAVSEILKLGDHLREKKGRKARVHNLSEIVHLVREQYDRTKRGDVGVQFPWPTMTRMTQGMWPGTLTFFVARPGVGKCVHEGTVIVDPVTGVPKTIRQMYEGDVAEYVGGASVTSWSKQDGVHVQPIAAKVDTGTKECLTFTMRSGRSVTVTPEHPFLTPEGWRRADEMARGSSVALPAVMPFPERPLHMSAAELDVLAVLLSEGSYSGNHVGFSTTDAAILWIAIEAADAMGVDVKYRSGCDYDFVRREKSGKNPVREMLRRMGIDRRIAKGKSIPMEVFQLPKEQLARFLSIFWMCDGTVSKRGDALITLASQKMVLQIQSLLLRFGVQSRVVHRDIKGGYEAWRLRVYSQCADAFRDEMTLWGKKGGRLGRRVARNPNVGSPRISQCLVDELSELSRSRAGRWGGGLHAEVANRLGRVGFSTKDLFGASGSVKMTAFRAFAHVYGVDDKFRWWWDSDIFWDEIEDIAEAGEQKVYDLTVRPTECFVANDVLVHNTWSAINICHNAWHNDGKKILIVSPEMGRGELAERVVCKHGALSYGDVISATLGNMGGEQRLDATIKQLQGSEGFYVLDDEDRMQPSYIEEAIDAIDPDLVAIDSMYMLRVEKGQVSSGPGSKGSRYDRILQTVDWLRSLSRRTQKPFLAISQLSRDAKMKPIDIERLKQGIGTGGLEDAVAMSDTLFMDAHNLFAMFQDEDMRLDKQMMYVPLKMRRQTGSSSVVCRWDMVSMNFEEIGTKVETGEGFKDDGFDAVSF